MTEPRTRTAIPYNRLTHQRPKHILMALMLLYEDCSMRDIHPQSVVGRHREAIKAIAEENGLTNVRLFGSRARGDHRRRSDVDLLVSPNGGDIFNLCSMTAHVEKLTGKKVDVATEAMLMNGIREEVLAEAIPL